MHDLKAIRQQPEFYQAAFARRGYPDILEKIQKLDAENRILVTQTQEYQTQRNALSKDIAGLKASGGNAESVMQQVMEIKEKMTAFEQCQGHIAEELHGILTTIPNILEEAVPDGKDEHDNQEIRRFGEVRMFDFTPKAHDDIGKQANGIDFSLAANVSGARFVYLKDKYALLERALTNFMLDTHTREFGYTEVSPPLLVKSQALFGTGQLPKFAEDLFKAGQEHYLIPTAEVSLTNMVAEQILTAEELPIRLTAATPCFRSEAGSAGRDTKGMIRQHQFIKVELVSIVPPEFSQLEHERMVQAAESILQLIGLPYRTILLCSGDTGFGARKTYDIEVWVPSQETYREISSCSNCGDFQARRMNSRYKNAAGKNDFVHTLNGSGLAVGRTMVALIENNQQADGSILLPDVLHPYMNGLTQI